MPVRTGSVQDELLRLSGSTNNPFETITTNGNGTPVYIGPDRMLACRLIIAGAVTGTGPTLDVALQICSDAAGTGAVEVARFPQQTASHATATGALAEPPTVPVRTTAAKPFLRIVKTVGGTTPSFGSVAVLHEPVPVPGA